MKNIKGNYTPEPGDFFLAKMGYFDIYHSLELDEVQSRIQERGISGICLSLTQDPDLSYRWVLCYMSTKKGDDQGKIKEIDIDFFDYVEFEKIS